MRPCNNGSEARDANSGTETEIETEYDNLKSTCLEIRSNLHWKGMGIFSSSDIIK